MKKGSPPEKTTLKKPSLFRIKVQKHYSLGFFSSFCLRFLNTYTAVRHELHKYDTSDTGETRATRVRYKCNTSATQKN